MRPYVSFGKEENSRRIERVECHVDSGGGYGVRRGSTGGRAVVAVGTLSRREDRWDGEDRESALQGCVML
jgi:hypothetical protein